MTNGVLALEVGLLVVAVPLLWKSASLRADQFNKWEARIEIAYADLSERALGCLRELQARTDNLLGRADAAFQPDLALAEPGPLRQLAAEFAAVLVSRQRLRRRFRLMLRTCQICPAVVLAFVVGMACVLLTTLGWVTPLWVAATGIAIVALTCLLGLVILGIYSYVNWHLSRAETLGRPVP